MNPFFKKPIRPRFAVPPVSDPRKQQIAIDNTRAIEAASDWLSERGRLTAAGVALRGDISTIPPALAMVMDLAGMSDEECAEAARLGPGNVVWSGERIDGAVVQGYNLNGELTGLIFLWSVRDVTLIERELAYQALRPAISLAEFLESPSDLVLCIDEQEPIKSRSMELLGYVSDTVVGIANRKRAAREGGSK